MKIYTKSGDAGETSLISGERVPKFHPLVEACGEVDECNSVLGCAGALTASTEIRRHLETLQNFLFVLGADLATPGNREIHRIGVEEVETLERSIDELQSTLPVLRAFVLPGGSPAAGQIHLARAIARRAERTAWAAQQTHQVNPPALTFLNRLSDFLFVLARRENLLAGIKENTWTPKKIGA
jgi:cob(I)alamin adenosyltransferase